MARRAQVDALRSGVRGVILRGSHADVVLCTIAGGGHQWPGGGVTLPLLGNKIDDLHATDAIWDFFVAHPRPM